MTGFETYCPPQIDLPERRPSPGWFDRAREVGRRATALTLAVASLGNLFPAAASAEQAEPVPILDSPVASMGCPERSLESGSLDCDIGPALPAACDPDKNPVLRKQLSRYYDDPLNHTKARFIVGTHARISSNQLPETGHMAFGIGDESGIRKNDRGSREALLWLGRKIGATRLREVIYPDVFKGKTDGHGYDALKFIDQSIRAGQACDYRVYLDLALNRQIWTPKNIPTYFKRIAHHFVDKLGVHDFSVGNETNLNPDPNPRSEDNWLWPMKGKNTLETYCAIWPRAYKILNAADKDVRVYLDEVSSLNHPLDHEEAILDCIKEHDPKHRPVETDGLAYHPYMKILRRWFARHPGRLPRFNRLVSPHSKVIGIDKLPTITRAIGRFYKQGKVRTPEGTEPPLLLTEFGFKSRSGGPGTDRANLPDVIRAKLDAKVLATTCRSKVEGLFHYMVQKASKLTRRLGDRYDSSFIGGDGVTDLDYDVHAVWSHSRLSSCLFGDTVPNPVALPNSASTEEGDILSASAKQ